MLIEDCHPLHNQPRFWSFSRTKIYITYFMPWLLIQGCYPLGTQRRFWSFCCYLVLPSVQDTYAWKSSPEVLSSNLQFPVHFFTSCCSVCFLRFYYFHSSCCPKFLDLYHLFVPYLTENTFVSPEMIKKYYNDLIPRKKGNFQKKRKTSSAALWQLARWT